MDSSLVVVPLAAVREVVGKHLSNSGFAVLFVDDCESALKPLRDRLVELIVVDDQTCRADGVDWIVTLRAVSDARIVVVSSCPTVAGCERAMRSGADRFLGFGPDLHRLGQIAREMMSTSLRPNPGGGSWTREEARALGERELRNRLQRLLLDCRGNIAEIARRMNRDRSTVRYHLRRMNLLE